MRKQIRNLSANKYEKLYQDGSNRKAKRLQLFQKYNGSDISVEELSQNFGINLT